MDVDELAQALRDERSLRLAAERRAAELAERTQLWRARAEERAERIATLEDERDLPWVRRALGTARRTLTARPGDTGTGAQTEDDAEADQVRGTRVAYPSTRVVAVAASPDVRRLASQFLDLEPTDDRAWHETDLVLLEDAAWQRAPADLRAHVQQWADRPGRAPLVRIVSPDPSVDDAPDGDLTLVIGADVAGAERFAPTFDPQVDAPWRPGEVVTRDPVDWERPARDELALAAGGRLARTGADPERSRAVALRLARRLHAPWRRAEELVALTGLEAARSSDRVGALLVSHRPELVAGALRNLLRARHVDMEVVVGVHGGAPPDELRALAEAAAVPCRVLELPGELSLGACLNRAAEATNAPLLAKIDDDDHYGPGHLEDAVQSLHHSGADLVGKAEQFTYVAAQDRTVLRRVGTRHAFIDGTPSGASWVFRRRLWEQAPFPHRRRRVDDLCLGAMRRVGATVHVNGPWEFCVTREDEGHTWVTDDDTFLVGADEAWPGRHDDRVELDESVVQ